MERLMVPENPRPQTPFSARRIALLASVAAVGGALLLGGPGGFDRMNLAGMTAPAHAAEAAQRPAGFADLVAKVKPAVISVRVKIESTAETTGSGGSNIPLQPGGPLDRFFQQFGSELPNGMRHRRQVVQGEGSGFFISPDGYAVTNNHVVDHASSVEVKTDDGKTYTAKVIGTDPKTDLALIKVDGASPFAYVKFSDQDRKSVV